MRRGSRGVRALRMLVNPWFNQAMEERHGAASLVIGGTGMLAEATRWVARNYSPTLLVARRAARFAEGDPRFVPLDLDWREPDFVERIGKSMGALPPIGKALIWLHDPDLFLDRLLSLIPPGNTVLVLGSMDGQPSLQARVDGLATVRLGSKPTPHGRRWLTHEEISAGAVKALQDGQSTAVGDLTAVR